ncbi:MAG: polysaccharide biosynthesis/export family protein [Candidatus Binataceae bacterium]
MCTRNALRLGVTLVLLLCTGCAPTGSMQVTPTESASQLTRTTALETDSGATSPADLEGLDKLWQQRTTSTIETGDYPIGPGDILSISVPQIAELSKSTARVGARGEITLPLLGDIQAAGLTEDQLEQELDRRLRKYMYHPQATVFVQEYRNRQVAVVGSVNKPGLVTLISPSETLIDVITRAGGLTPEAADQIVLIPAQPGSGHMARQVVAATVLPPANNVDKPASDAPDLRVAAPGQTQSATQSANDPEAPIEPGVAGAAAQKPVADSEMSDAGTAALALMPTNAHPLVIRLKSTSLTGAGRFINMPVRPGDVIVVPGGGNVMVVGWVQHPGYFRVGSGLTVMGAIGAAGGPMYAANTTDVALIRSEPSGKVTVAVNLADIATGKEQDLPVKANDVIDVPYSGARIGPYIFYQIISRMGIMGPAVPF